MRAFKVFIFGLLYGWFFKVAFDRIYRDHQFEDIRNENMSLRDYIHSLETRLGSPSRESESMQRTEFRAAPAPEPVAEPEDAPEPAPKGIPVPPDTLGATEELKDDLKIIKGIGPAIERKLNNAGIFTFAALARLSSEQLEGILGSQVKRLQDENDLLAQARELAEQPPQG